MYVDDLDIPPVRITKAAQRVIDRAVEEARRRNHSLLTPRFVLRRASNGISLRTRCTPPA
jgi:hypothetical protein